MAEVQQQNELAQQQQQQQQQRAPLQYEYRVLTDILEGNIPMECNLYAVIVECSVPRPTRRFDWMCNVRLVDPSTLGHCHLQEGVEVLMFGPPHLLPNPDSVGDIIRIHRLTVQEYKEKPQLVATVGPKKRCQHCLFKGRAVEGEPIVPYRASTQGYTMGEREENLVKLLRNAMSLISDPSTAPSKYMKRINELDPRNMFTETPDGILERNTFFDICCRVLYVQGEGNRRIMYVWDGTDAPSLPKRADTRHDFAEDQNVTLDEDEELLHYDTVELPLQECGAVPRLGTAVPVRLYGLDALPQAVPLPLPGAWVKLRNVAACVINGQLQGLFRKSSKWCPWEPPLEALQVLDRREAEGRIQEWAPQDNQELLTRTSFAHNPFQTLREVHQEAAHGRGTKHRCLVRVVDYSPEEPTQWCSPAAAARITGPQLLTLPLKLSFGELTRQSSSWRYCSEGFKLVGGCSAGLGDWLYTFYLILQDATGEVEALVFAENGTEFFGGMPAENLTDNAAQAENLKSVVQRLVGDENAWIECCLSSYTKRDGDVTRRLHRLFSTSLRPYLLHNGDEAH